MPDRGDDLLAGPEGRRDRHALPQARRAARALLPCGVGGGRATRGRRPRRSVRAHARLGAAGAGRRVRRHRPDRRPVRNAQAVAAHAGHRPLPGGLRRRERHDGNPPGNGLRHDRGTHGSRRTRRRTAREERRCRSRDAISSSRTSNSCPGSAASCRNAQDVRVSEFGGSGTTGFSNDTLLFELSWREDGREHTENLVLRIEPAGLRVFPEYDLGLQYGIMQALANTDVPVPRMLWRENDSAILAQSVLRDGTHRGSDPRRQPAVPHGRLDDGDRARGAGLHLVERHREPRAHPPRRLARGLGAAGAARRQDAARGAARLLRALHRVGRADRGRPLPAAGSGTRLAAPRSSRANGSPWACAGATRAWAT